MVGYKQIIKEVVHEFWNDNPDIWWSKPTKIKEEKQSDGQIIYSYLINEQTADFKSTDLVDGSRLCYGLMRSIIEEKIISLYAIPLDLLEKEETDIIVGFINGPNDRENVIWAWENKCVYPSVSRGYLRDGHTFVKEQYKIPECVKISEATFAICAVLDSPYRQVIANLNVDNYKSVFDLLSKSD